MVDIFFYNIEKTCATCAGCVFGNANPRSSEVCRVRRFAMTYALPKQNSTTTMVKESFTTGNSEVSRRDMASYLMRRLLVDKLQGEVTPFGLVRACQKIIVF